MLSFQGGPQNHARWQRREWLRVGGLSMLGLGLPQLLAAQPPREADAENRLTAGLAGTMFGQAKNVIYLWLQGGPPQHETFDPKPDAPLEIRGPFKPVQTNVPGIHFSELLPRTAMRADKLAVIRSLATDDNNHDVSGYWVLTGYPYGPGTARQIKPHDWPYFGSVVKMLKPSERVPALTSVWLPDMMRLNDNVTPAGQTAGFLGAMWEPERFVGDPASSNYQISGLTLPVELPPERVQDRAALLRELELRRREGDRAVAGGTWDQLTSFALDLVSSGRAKEAFDLTRESPELRDRYGRHTWGQSCLLARRLIEAGVRLVHVNWPREPGDNAVDNPMWDTHTLNADRLHDTLCPTFDTTFAALLDDLEQRGLLSETLVVAVGEFGRTPKINSYGGRDHWGPVFCAALAGAGISGGQVFGASDRNGAYPIVDPIRPHDLTATIFHLLGISPSGVFHDRTGRPQLLTKGEPLHRLLGDGPATVARCPSTADENFVPPVDDRLIYDTDFAWQKLQPTVPPTRERGWRASPESLLPSATLRVATTPAPQPGVMLGVIDPPAQPVTIAAGAQAFIAQEIKNARGGHYSLTVRLKAEATSADVSDRLFSALTCRLVLFRYDSQAKNPLESTVLAEASFQPQLAPLGQWQEQRLSQFLGPSVPGTNFPIGNGLGIRIEMVCRTPVTVAAGERAALRLQQVELVFQPRQRDDNVTI